MLGAKLHALRKRNKLTLEDLSRRTRLSIGFLSDLENGKVGPSIATLANIASVYGTTVSELLRDVEVPENYQGYAPSFVDFMKHNEVNPDMVHVLTIVERHCKNRCHTEEAWRELYYALSRLMRG
jgi:transcriptional regulator with XRE-family HTH domain